MPILTMKTETQKYIEGMMKRKGGRKESRNRGIKRAGEIWETTFIIWRGDANL